MNAHKITFIMFLIFITLGCGSSRLSRTDRVVVEHSINTVAMAPGGGVLADAIGVELFNKGFNIIDTNETSQLMYRLNIDELEVSLPRNLKILKNQGIDACLFVRSAAGIDGLPQSASVRMNSTHTGAIITGISWQNAWGGTPSSIVDRMMRKDINEAAEEIATELVKRIKKY